MTNTRLRKAKYLSVVPAALALAAGCTYPGDTSGFKAEKIPSKEQINQQIAQIKANPNLPDNVKAMALKKLEKDRETAH
jgi:hypothetical protein